MDLKPLPGLKSPNPKKTAKTERRMYKWHRKARNSLQHGKMRRITRCSALSVWKTSDSEALSRDIVRFFSNSGNYPGKGETTMTFQWNSWNRSRSTVKEEDPSTRSFDQFDPDGLKEVRWRGPFEGYR